MSDTGLKDANMCILQATQLESHSAFQGDLRSALINCGTHKGQPIFVIRHDKGDSSIGAQFVYSIHTCRCALKMSHAHLTLSCQ